MSGLFLNCSLFQTHMLDDRAIATHRRLEYMLNGHIRVGRITNISIPFERLTSNGINHLDNVIKAMRRGNREGQQEVLGPGFHSTNHVHRSKKTYTRKQKHKGTEE